MRFVLGIAAVWVFCLAAAAQSGPALSIDVNAGRHAISPDVYGINFYWSVGTSVDPTLAAAAPTIRPTLRRWGGNNTSTYNWQLDVDNLDSDWFYEVLPDSVDASKLPAGSSFNAYADQARTTGGRILATVPILGWLPFARQEMCSFNQAKYTNQCKIDPFYANHQMTCGDGIQYTSACGTPSVNDGKTPSNPVYIKNDPSDAYAQYDQTFQAQWVQYLISRYGKGAQGGVAIWSLDNEPIWWDSTHRDIHPNPYTYDEVLSLDTTYAAAIKQADPTALISGPVADNWASLFFSKKDIVAGWSSPSGKYWSNPVDRNAHGGVPFLSWYLQQMQSYQQQHGMRLLDILDVHAYYEPSAVDSGTETASIDALRLDSTRELWDPTYVVSGDYWIVDPDNNGAPVAPQLIPRLRQTVAQNYPGTKIAISEYNWSGLTTLNGALAQAELLGVFGREQLDMATLWGPPSPTDPGAFAFRIYRNCDGMGGGFGETSVQSVSTDPGSLSVFGALRSDLNLTAMVINKTGNDLTSTLSLANFTPAAAAHVWRYSGANLGAIVAEPDVATSSGSISTVFPANSITLLVIAPATLPVPKPVVLAVTNAASYGTAVAPGQMVDVWGSNLGPQSGAGLALDSNGMVSASVAGVRILFNGIPAPLIYVSAAQCSAIVPYFGASTASTNVQVEYQGARSDPFPLTVSATAPGLFTANQSGTGQGSILNQDNTVNSMTNPAAPGSVVILWATGEGVTDPPGVDGRPAVDVLPKPVAPVTVTIGGLPATVQYAGAAPGYMPGILQINAQMSADVQPGISVPVQIMIGGVAGQDSVTLVVH